MSLIKLLIPSSVFQSCLTSETSVRLFGLVCAYECVLVEFVSVCDLRI